MNASNNSTESLSKKDISASVENGSQMAMEMSVLTEEDSSYVRESDSVRTAEEGDENTIPERDTNNLNDSISVGKEVHPYDIIKSYGEWKDEVRLY